MRKLPEARFIFQLARELNYTVMDLMDHITDEELLCWSAFYKMEAEDRERGQR